MSAVMELVKLPEKDTALAVYSAEKGLDPYLAKIKAEIDAFSPGADATTEKGRDEIRSFAFKVTRSKTALDGMGKDLVAGLKDVPKKIDAERKRMREQLDEWQAAVRLPLTKWEEAEEARKTAHAAGIERMRFLASEPHTLDATELQHCLSEIESVELGERWQEFEAEAAAIKTRSLARLSAALDDRQKLEKEQAELARLRAAETERQRIEAEQAAARAAEERIRKEAETLAQRQRDEDARKLADERAAADRREAALTLQANQAEQAAAASKREAEASKQRAERAAENARLAEVQRRADEQAQVERDRRAREDDENHRRTINRAAMDAFIANGLNSDCAMLAVKLIAQNKIPAIEISY